MPYSRTYILSNSAAFVNADPSGGVTKLHVEDPKSYIAISPSCPAKSPFPGVVQSTAYIPGCAGDTGGVDKMSMTCPTHTALLDGMIPDPELPVNESQPIPCTYPQKSMGLSVVCAASVYI